MAEEEQIKKPRGNPNLQKGKNGTPSAAEGKETPKEENTGGDGSENDDAPEASTGDKLPSDLFSDKMPSSETLPLDGEVKVKDYAALPNEGAAPAPTGDKASTEPPKPFDDSSAPSVQAMGAAPAPPLTPDEEQSQAKQTVDLMLKGYEKLHGLGRWAGKIDKGELGALHSSGDIDLQKELPIGRNTTTVGDFFDDYNKGIDENIVVTEEFKDNIRPPLTRIVIKNKWFLSDEMYVGMIVAEDLTTKMSMLLGLKKTANMVLDAVKAMSKAEKESKKKKDKPKDNPAATDVPNMEDVDWREVPDPNEQTDEGAGQ